MKKMMLTLLVTTVMVQLNACGGFFLDDGSRAKALNDMVREGNLNKAQLIIAS